MYSSGLARRFDYAKGHMHDIVAEWEDHVRITEGPDFEKARTVTLEWIKQMCPDYERLLSFAAELKMTCVDQAAEIRKLEKHQELLHMDQSLLGLLMENALPEPALLSLVDRLADRETDPTMGAMARAIAFTRLQNKNQAKHTARLGGLGKAAKLKALQDATIALYEAGTWPSVPLAAIDITPVVVEMSKNGNGDLAPTTNKPLQWIREYNNAKKK